MQLYYKIFLILFLVFIGINLYAIDWYIGFLHEENSKYIFSIAAAIIGILVVYVMHNWRKLSK